MGTENKELVEWMLRNMSTPVFYGDKDHYPFAVRLSKMGVVRLNRQAETMSVKSIATAKEFISLED